MRTQCGSYSLKQHVVRSPSHVQLFVTPGTAAHQASATSPSPRVRQVHAHCISDATQPSHPLPSSFLPPSVFPSIRVIANELPVCVNWPTYWSFSFSINTSSEDSRLISFKSDRFDLLLSKGLSRVFSSTTVLKHQFFSAQPSLWSSFHSYVWLLKEHSLDYMDLCWQSDVCAF